MHFRLLQLYVFLLPFETLWEVLFGIDTTLKPYRIIGVVVLTISLISLLTTRNRIHLDFFDRGYLTMLSYGLMMAVFWKLVGGTGNLTSALSDCSLILFGLCVAIAIKNELTTWRRAEIFLSTFQWATVLSLGIFLVMGGSVHDGRFSGFYDNPNSYAGAMAASIAIAVAKILFPQTGVRPLGYLLNGGTILALSVAILFTGSRGPIVALAIGLLSFSVPLMKRSSRSNGRLSQRAFLLLPVLIGGAILTNDTFEREKDQSAAFTRYELEVAQGGSGRWDIWKSALLVAQDHYYTGVGVGQYRHYHRKYARNLETVYNTKMLDSDLTTHSEYLNTLTAYGIIGILLFLMIVRTLYRNLTWQLATQKNVSFLLAASLPLLLLFLVTQVTHNTYSSPQYYLLMALIVRGSLYRNHVSTNNSLHFHEKSAS